MEWLLWYAGVVWREEIAFMSNWQHWVIMVLLAIVMTLVNYRLNHLTKRRTQVRTLTAVIFAVGINWLAYVRFANHAWSGEALQYTVMLMTVILFWIIGLHCAYLLRKSKDDPIGTPFRWSASRLRQIADLLEQRADDDSPFDAKKKQVLSRLEKAITNEAGASSTKS